MTQTTTTNELLARAKADPEAFRLETVKALRSAGYDDRASMIDGGNVEGGLRDKWWWINVGLYLSAFRSVSEDRRLVQLAKAHNDALLQALTEMTPAEREKLGW